MGTTPVFAVTPIIGMGQVATANTNRDGTGTITNLVTGSTSGTRIEQVDICAAGTTTAGVVRLFIFDGTNTRLFYEQLIQAATPSATVDVERYTLTFDNLVLPNTYQLRASTHNAETFNIFCFGANI